MSNRHSDRSTTMRKLGRPTLVVLVSLAFAQPVLAAGPLAAGAGVGAQAGAGVNAPRVGVGATAGVSGSAGVQANAPQPNARALENSNGGIAPDRSFGLDRAQERMSEQGAANQKATDAVTKRAARNAAASSNTSTESSSSAAARAPRKSSATVDTSGTAETKTDVKQ